MASRRHWSVALRQGDDGARSHHRRDAKEVIPLSTSNADRDFARAPRPTRRAVLQGAFAVAIVGGGASRARAQDKAKQSLVQYQEKPKGDQECDRCALWAPPDACKVVEGKINPKGWCALYAPKPK
jgi:high potential iron-sulfur protein